MTVQSLYSGAIILCRPLPLPEGFISKYAFLNNDNTEAFGLDLFGNLFILKHGRCYFLIIETGDSERVAESLETFYKALERNREYYAPESLLHDWEEYNEKLPEGHRLMPVIPFFLGGQYAADNLRSAPTDQVLGLFADIHTQTRDLPDGSVIEFNFSD